MSARNEAAKKAARLAAATAKATLSVTERNGLQAKAGLRVVKASYKKAKKAIKLARKKLKSTRKAISHARDAAAEADKQWRKLERKPQAAAAKKAKAKTGATPRTVRPSTIGKAARARKGVSLVPSAESIAQLSTAGDPSELSEQKGSVRGSK